MLYSEGVTYAVIQGEEGQTSAEAIEQAKKEHGGDWLMGLRWTGNPAPEKKNGVETGKYLWLLRKV